MGKKDEPKREPKDAPIVAAAPRKRQAYRCQTVVGIRSGEFSRRLGPGSYVSQADYEKWVAAGLVEAEWFELAEEQE